MLLGESGVWEGCQEVEHFPSEAEEHTTGQVPSSPPLLRRLPRFLIWLCSPWAPEALHTGSAPGWVRCWRMVSKSPQARPLLLIPPRATLEKQQGHSEYKRARLLGRIPMPGAGLGCLVSVWGW